MSGEICIQMVTDGLRSTHTYVGHVVSHKEWTCVLATRLTLIEARHRVPEIRSCTASQYPGEIGTCAISQPQKSHLHFVGAWATHGTSLLMYFTGAPGIITRCFLFVFPA